MVRGEGAGRRILLLRYIQWGASSLATGELCHSLGLIDEGTGSLP